MSTRSMSDLAHTVSCDRLPQRIAARMERSSFTCSMSAASASLNFCWIDSFPFTCKKVPFCRVEPVLKCSPEGARRWRRKASITMRASTWSSSNGKQRRLCFGFLRRQTELFGRLAPSIDPTEAPSSSFVYSHLQKRWILLDSSLSFRHGALLHIQTILIWRHLAMLDITLEQSEVHRPAVARDVVMFVRLGPTRVAKPHMGHAIFFV